MNSLTYLNISTLRVVLFWHILKTNKFELLDEHYDSKKEYSNEQLQEAAIAFKSVYDEFYDSRENKSGKYLLDKSLELSTIAYKLELLGDIENRLILLINMSGEYLEEFKETRRREAICDFKEIYPRVKINVFSTLEDALDIVQQVIKSQTNIYDEKTGVKEKNVKKQEETIEYVIAMISKNLGYNLDSNTLTCASFVANEKLVLNINKNSGKSGKK